MYIYMHICEYGNVLSSAFL